MIWERLKYMAVKCVHDFFEKYIDESVCEEYFLNLRIEVVGLTCDNCGYKNYDNTVKIEYYMGDLYKDHNKFTFNGKQNVLCECKNCGQKFMGDLNWMFNNSPITYKQWLLAIYYTVLNENSVSSIELSNKIGITPTSAWKAFVRIANCLKHTSLFQGEMEMDECYLSGDETRRHKNKHSPYPKGVIGISIPVIGLYERRQTKNTKANGRLVLQPLKISGNRSVRISDITPIKEKYIAKSENNILFTDAAKIYKSKTFLDGMRHEFVVHYMVKDEELEYDAERFFKYTEDGKRNTSNGIEGAFGNFKTYERGTHRSITSKHADKYTKTFCFRWNHKHLDIEKQMEILAKEIIATPYQPLKKLITKDPTGRLSQQERNEIAEQNKKRKELNKYLDSLSRQTLDERNNLFVNYYLLHKYNDLWKLLKTDSPNEADLYKQKYNEHTDLFQRFFELIKSNTEFPSYAKIYQEYEDLMSIKNTRNRLHECNILVKVGAEKFYKKATAKKYTEQVVKMQGNIKLMQTLKFVK